MKKKSMLKRMAAVLMGTVILLGTAGAVSAASAPDLTGRGSLQIFKQNEKKEPIAGVTLIMRKLVIFISQRRLLYWDTPSQIRLCLVI